MRPKKLWGTSPSQHPDWTSVATRLQNDGQNLCRNVCARSVEAAKSLKQRLGLLGGYTLVIGGLVVSDDSAWFEYMI